MKKCIYLLSLILLVTTLFTAAPAKAESIYTTSVSEQSFFDSILEWLGFDHSSSKISNSVSSSNKQDYTTNKGTASNSAHLPINNGIILLMAAGVVIGITTVRKEQSKAAL